MTKLQMSELLKLSVKDKIRVVQTLWDDIAVEQSIGTLPAEHKRILQERLNKIDAGKATFSSWEDIQKKYSKG
jgi:putative addiction module component (TIGR02574 family)